MFFKVESVRISFPFILVVVALFGMVCSPANAQNVSAGLVKTAEMAWVKQVDTGNKVLYSFLQEGEWSSPVQLSRDKLNNLVPTMASSENGRTFVVWTVLTGSGSTLHYVTVRGGVIETEQEKISTNMITSIAPFVAVDLDGIPWLTWSGDNGSTSDIFFSRWENGRWLSSKRVHAKNDVPDILPELEVGQDGSVLVSWKTYRDDGYVIVSKVLKDAESPKAQDRLNAAVVKNIYDDPMSCIKMLPVKNVEFQQAVLLSRCRENVRTTQTRFFKR